MYKGKSKVEIIIPFPYWKSCIGTIKESKLYTNIDNDIKIRAIGIKRFDSFQ